MLGRTLRGLTQKLKSQVLTCAKARALAAPIIAQRRKGRVWVGGRLDSARRLAHDSVILCEIEVGGGIAA